MCIVACGLWRNIDRGSFRFPYSADKKLKQRTSNSMNAAYKATASYGKTAMCGFVAQSHRPTSKIFKLWRTMKIELRLV